ncbi:MAG: tetratricopeptide repeat protein [Nitrospinota bacterium]
MPSPHPANLESGLSFLGPGTRLEGALRFSGRMVLNGRFTGEVEGAGRLEIGARAEAEGTFRAEELVVRGMCQGELLVGRRVELGAGCHHRGSIEAPRVQIHPQARLEGFLRMPDVQPLPPRRPAMPGRRRMALALLLLLLAGGAASASFFGSAPDISLPSLQERTTLRLTRFWDTRLAPWVFVTGGGPGDERGTLQGELLEEAARLESRGALAEAAERLKRAAALPGPRARVARFRLAKALASLERGPEAVAQLEALLTGEPGHIEGLILLGDLQSRAGAFEKAARAYADALRRDPDDVVLKRRLEGVQGHLQKNAAPGPRPAPIPPAGTYLAEAEKHLAEKRAARAVSVLKQGIGHYPRDARLHFELGAALAAMGTRQSQEEAIEVYAKVVDLAPDWLDAYVRLGALYEAGGQDKEAIELYERAAKLDRSNVDMLVRIARLHRSRGRLNVAHRMLLKLQEEHPRSVAVLFDLGMLLWESGKSEESKEVFRRVIEVDPNSAPSLNRLAWFHAIEEKNIERGIELSRRSLELQPDTPAFLDTLAELFYRNGQALEAVSYIQRAIRLDPNNRYFRLQLEKFRRASR